MRRRRGGRGLGRAGGDMGGYTVLYEYAQAYALDARGDKFRFDSSIIIISNRTLLRIPNGHSTYYNACNISLCLYKMI